MDEGEFGRELSATLRELFQNLSAQIAGNERTEQVLRALLIIVAVAVGMAVLLRVIELVFNVRVRRAHRAHFESIVELLNDTKLDALARSCNELGRRVDRHTNRRHNSERVGELVFAVATAMEVEKSLAAVYFCVSMVYDAGFLDLPAELFQAEILSGKERKLLRTHVQRFHSYFAFVPDAYYADFTSAATYHHEDVNGKGYPEGLRGGDIPLCARIIRVVESYVALTSPRSYHKVLDGRRALAVLRRCGDMYDPAVVDALASVL